MNNIYIIESGLKNISQELLREAEEKYPYCKDSCGNILNKNIDDFYRFAYIKHRHEDELNIQKAEKEKQRINYSEIKYSTYDLINAFNAGKEKEMKTNRYGSSGSDDGDYDIYYVDKYPTFNDYLNK